MSRKNGDRSIDDILSDSYTLCVKMAEIYNLNTARTTFNIEEPEQKIKPNESGTSAIEPEEPSFLQETTV